MAILPAVWAKDAMNVLIQILKTFSPDFFKKRVLKELFIITARAFDREIPSLEGLSHQAGLRQYALFTRAAVEEYTRLQQDLPGIRIRLYDQAYRLGHQLRNQFRIKTDGQVMAMGRILYEVLGIEFQDAGQGRIAIHKCFFSEYYTGPICQLISALDEGVLSGLSGGGRLDFSQRLTEGKECCQAQFVSGAVRV
jgi:hypothetical protein